MDARRRLIDALAAAAVAGALCLRAAAPFEEEAVAPDWRSYALMIAIGAFLLVRRHYPLAVLLASLGALMVYYVLGFGAVGATWPLAPALFNAALLGRWQAAGWTAGFVVVGSSMWRLFFDVEPPTLATAADIITEILTALAVILAGAMIRNHRLLRSEIRAREKAVAAERDAEARSRLTEQRLGIAREIHDTVAHSLSGIGVQARVAQEVLDTDADEARRSIRSIIDATSEAMSQLRDTVGGLRSAPSPSPTLQSVVEGATGVEVELVLEGEGANEEGQVEAAVRAIVREALTNVVRHAEASKARVVVTRRRDSVRLEVTDDGGGSEFVEGHGIRGMRERAASVGGWLQVGPSPSGGFTVTAELPR